MSSLLIGPVGSQSLKILTYNIRLDNPGDGADAWTNRRAWLCEQIKQVYPDLFGIQEGLISQINYLDSALLEYRHIGVGRSDGKIKGEFSAIYYNAKRFKMLDQGTFWLSLTPDKVSVGWDAALERICTYGLFQDNTSGKKFWMFNTHFDHMGVKARKISALLILKEMKRLNTSGFPALLTGDFNATPESEPIKLLSTELQDSKAADKSMMMGPGGTFNNFDTTNPATERIDYIFTGKGLRVANYYILRETRDGRYPSDHFPVIAILKFDPE
jgi:endonuclease/exonuclease/phosphatase family metal-dependent hydrolase